MHVPEKNLYEYQLLRSVVHALESLEDYRLGQQQSTGFITGEISKYREQMDALRAPGKEGVRDESTAHI